MTGPLQCHKFPTPMNARGAPDETGLALFGNSMEEGHQPDPRDRLRGVKGKVCVNRGLGGDQHAIAPGPARWEQGAWRSPRCPPGGPGLQVRGDGCVASECRGHSPGRGTKARRGCARPRVLNAAPDASAGGARGGVGGLGGSPVWRAPAPGALLRRAWGGRGGDRARPRGVPAPPRLRPRLRPRPPAALPPGPP